MIYHHAKLIGVTIDSLQELNNIDVISGKYLIRHSDIGSMSCMYKKCLNTKKINANPTL